MSKEEYTISLKDAGIHPTPGRVEIWKTINEKMHEAFSLSDLENVLLDMDKSTLFRALSLFAEAHLLHPIDDGSGCQKYCVCHCKDKNHHHGHVHITCTKCHRTWCLEDEEIPKVPVPDNFEILEAEYVIKGICPNCLNEK
ncbi:MAG: transcriptional repressor [Bacteroidaceae bacterium]|nr:transcriptional repressor [Bacteroidaceae bacterium]